MTASTLTIRSKDIGGEGVILLRAGTSSNRLFATLRREKYQIGAAMGNVYAFLDETRYDAPPPSGFTKESDWEAWSELYDVAKLTDILSAAGTISAIEISDIMLDLIASFRASHTPIGRH